MPSLGEDGEYWKYLLFYQFDKRRWYLSISIHFFDYKFVEYCTMFVTRSTSFSVCWLFKALASHLLVSQFLYFTPTTYYVPLKYESESFI